MKNRFCSFVTRAFLMYQIIKTVRTLTRLINRYAEKRLGVQRNYGPPRTYYRR
jgi:hypothetical protein